MFIVQRLIYSAIQWYIKPTENGDIYTITAGTHAPRPGAPGFRREKGPGDVLNVPLPGDWYFVPVKGEPHVFQSALFSENPVYATNQFQSVYPTDIYVGGQELLGTKGDKVNSPLLMRMTRLSVFMQVVIQRFPIGTPRDELPSWYLTGVAID